VINKSTIEPDGYWGKLDAAVSFKLQAIAAAKPTANCLSLHVNKEIYEFYKRLPWGISQLTIFTNPPYHYSSLSHPSQSSQLSQFRYDH